MNENSIVQAIITEWRNIDIVSNNNTDNVDLIISLLSLKLETTKPIDIKDIRKLEKSIIQCQNEDLKKMLELCHQYISIIEAKEKNDRLSNSEVMEFDGDVLIIDPTRLCSIEQINLGYKSLKDLGLTGIEHLTTSGNWECYVYDITTQGAIGKFDSVNERVCVVSLNEVNKRIPHFSPDPDVCTVVKNFKGTMQIKVYQEKGTCECYIDANGIHKDTEKPFVFTSCQTKEKP